MNPLIADEVLLAQLEAILEPVEIRDVGGKLLGHYTPVLPPDLQAQYTRAEQMVDPEETRRRKEAGREGVAIEQVMQRLKSLETSG